MIKKERECHWMELARRARPDLFLGAMLPGESPDFVFAENAVRVGVEVTRYAREVNASGLPPEEQTGLRFKLMDMAKRSFASRSSAQLRVGCVFSGAPLLRYARLPAIANELADYLAKKLQGAGEWTRLRWSIEDDGAEPEPPPEISSVYATVIPSVANMHWYPAQAGWVWYAERADIQRTVRRKEPKLEAYRRRCDQIVLLIVFDGMPHDATAVHAPEEPVGFALSTGFDRVLCLDALEGRAVNIPVVPPVT